MILVDNYFLAILCCVICCACWGSWANTQKMVAAKQWSFELFYWDLTVGLFLTALLGAVTLGSMGSEGRTFFQDLAVMDWSSIQYAFLGPVFRVTAFYSVQGTPDSRLYRDAYCVARRPKCLHQTSVQPFPPAPKRGKG